MKKLLPLLVLLPQLLQGDLSTSSISSKKAAYDGNTLILNGKVQLEHALGKMESEVARLKKEGKDERFSSITLRDNVLISLKNHGKISCAAADFDFTHMKGTLLPSVGKAIQFDHIHDKLCSFSSQHADIELSKESDAFQIAKVCAEGAVHIQYGEDFFLDAESAIYSNETTPYIQASPNCKLTHFDDQIRAQKIELFPDSAKVVLSSPQGHIQPSTFAEDQGITFSCNRMLWENTPQILTLQGNVSILDETLGKMHCEETIELRQKQRENKRILTNIKASGKTELRYELEKTSPHTLVCHGLMQLDQERLILTAKSTGKEPVTYLYDHMQLLADQAQLDYAQSEQKMQPKQLTLNGGVRLSSTKDSLRCALADQLSYDLKEDKMILSATDGGNVLFWDEEQDLSVSAQEVHIQRKSEAGDVKGVGNVRFAFSSAENELLKKLFPFYRSKRKSP